MTRKPRRRFFGVVVLAAVLATGVYAYTAGNTVPATVAGTGSQAIDGFTASNVSYSLNATSPSNIDSVTFTISPATATSVKIKLEAAGSWYSCTNASGSVTCATTSPQATVSGSSQLTVLAAQ